VTSNGLELRPAVRSLGAPATCVADCALIRHGVLCGDDHIADASSATGIAARLVASIAKEFGYPQLEQILPKLPDVLGKEIADGIKKLRVNRPEGAPVLPLVRSVFRSDFVQRIRLRGRRALDLRLKLTL